jgi:chromate transporter
MGSGQIRPNIDWLALGMAAAAAVALLRYRFGVMPVIAASALAGLALRLAGWA